MYCILQDSQRFDDLLSTRFEFLPLSDLILSKAPACRNFWKAHYPAEFLLGKGRVILKSTMLSRVPWETEERRKVSHCFISSNGLKLGCSWYKHPLKQGVPIKTPHYKGHLFWGPKYSLAARATYFQNAPLWGWYPTLSWIFFEGRSTCTSIPQSNHVFFPKFWSFRSTS